MKASGMILEFVVIGTIAAAVLVLPLWLMPEARPTIPRLTASGVAAAGVAILFLLYFVGTLAHFATWWWWRRVFHRRWFSSWLESDSGTLYLPLAEEAFAENSSPPARELARSLSLPRMPGFILDWCRFYVFQCGASELQVQYLRQFHLYRLAYGPLTAMLIAFLIAIGLAVPAWIEHGPSLPMLLIPALLVLVATSVAAAHHRVGRMWKYLCYSAWVVSRSRGVASTLPESDANG